ncbi:DUF1471 domain-containing protein [Erwinia sp. S63]|uniref:YdgH/BhsA/McbA-like domain containing protein n=1 Tax=Erwinia sp. S63 TaxID=2769341 RepID=UPI00190B1101|nr:YdgH/BhsA/McbA-like domain containing protein [Erwinia sp. S63]MBK0096141.1 DUF1471 domain-containing protein [Erwinia sp. S63]
MNNFKMIAMLAAVFMSMSFSVMAAQEISKDEAKNYTEVGTVSTSGTFTDPKDAKDELSKLADEKGGKYYVITSARVEGKVQGTATVYK